MADSDSLVSELEARRGGAPNLLGRQDVDADPAGTRARPRADLAVEATGRSARGPSRRVSSVYYRSPASPSDTRPVRPPLAAAGRSRMRALVSEASGAAPPCRTRRRRRRVGSPRAVAAPGSIEPRCAASRRPHCPRVRPRRTRTQSMAAGRADARRRTEEVTLRLLERRGAGTCRSPRSPQPAVRLEARSGTRREAGSRSVEPSARRCPRTVAPSVPRVPVGWSSCLAVRCCAQAGGAGRAAQPSAAGPRDGHAEPRQRAARSRASS